MQNLGDEGPAAREHDALAHALQQVVLHAVEQRREEHEDDEPPEEPAERSGRIDAIDDLANEERLCE